MGLSEKELVSECVVVCCCCCCSGAFTELVSVLKADGRGAAAAELLSRATALASIQGHAVQGGWWGPSATGEMRGEGEGEGEEGHWEEAYIQLQRSEVGSVGQHPPLYGTVPCH